MGFLVANRLVIKVGPCVMQVFSNITRPVLLARVQVYEWSMFKNIFRHDPHRSFVLGPVLRVFFAIQPERVRIR